MLHPGKMFLSFSDGGLKAERLGKQVLPHVVLPRIGSTIRSFPLTLLRQMEFMGIPLVNGSEAVARARNKFQTIQSLAAGGVPVPESHFVSNERNLAAAARQMGARPFVVKTAQGRQGTGVFLVRNQGQAIRLLQEHMSIPGEGMVLQEFIPPEARRRDIRVLVMGGRAESSIALQPRQGEFRANIHQRARCEPFQLTKPVEQAALKAAEALGLDICGIDMIELFNGSLKIVDVNYSPGFKGLERCTGKDIASLIISFVTSFKGRAG